MCYDDSCDKDEMVYRNSLMPPKKKPKFGRYTYLSQKYFLFFSEIKSVEFVFDSSNFPDFRKPNRFFYDFTRFIIEIDKMFSTSIRTLMLYRNRRMGKSLLLSALNYYYNIDYENQYDGLFNGLDIQKHNSNIKNTMYVLKLDFSSISVKDVETFSFELNAKINHSVREFIKKHGMSEGILQSDSCLSLFSLDCEMQKAKKSLLILIDEYDSAITRFFNRLSEMAKLQCKKNEDSDFMNYFRQIFIQLKTLVTNNSNFYIFLTGVSPQALNDFTSGFNIGLSIGELFNCANILGYPEEQITEGLKLIRIPNEFKPIVLNKLRDENNGHRYYYGRLEQKSVYNPSKINFCFYNMKNLMDCVIENNVKFKDSEDFLNFIFEFPNNVNLNPAESVLMSLMEVPKIEDILIKFINCENCVAIEENLRGPHLLSYWNFNNLNQVMSYLFYLGALTYAPYQTSEKSKKFLKIPNSNAQVEYLDVIKNLKTKKLIKLEGR